MSKTTSLLEEWEFRVTGKDFFFVGRIFLKGDENAATLLFTQHTSLLAHKNAVQQHGSDLVCSSKDRLCAVVVVVVGIGGRRSTRAHTQRRSRHAQTERERERERERDENL